MTDELLIERDGHVTTLTLARPAKLNALTSPILEALVRAADMLERDDDCRAVILTGEGPKAFCAGADIVEWATSTRWPSGGTGSEAAIARSTGSPGCASRSSRC